MSGDPEQEYFADGIVDEIITALSRFRSLFVIARNSTFAYKNRSVDVKQVGRELGVRYVLEGGVRKAANRVRIIGQLIDATTGAHIWANRFEGALEDVFDLQDRVTEHVVGAVVPKLERAEIERSKRKPIDNLDAYDYFLRGLAIFHNWTREDVTEALRLFYRAIELDPDFASAYGMAALCYARRKTSNWVTDVANEIVEAKRLARRAVELNKDDAFVLCAAGFALVYVAHESATGAAFVDRAIAINPNLSLAWQQSGWVKVWLGNPDLAIEHFAHAMRLSPLDPLIAGMQQGTAHAHFFAGRYDDASIWAEMALTDAPNLHPALRILAASNALVGREKEAKRVCTRLRQINPTLRVSNLRNLLGPYRPEDLARYEEGLRKAGLPE